MNMTDKENISHMYTLMYFVFDTKPNSEYGF